MAWGNRHYIVANFVYYIWECVQRYDKVSAAGKFDRPDRFRNHHMQYAAILATKHVPRTRNSEESQWIALIDKWNKNDGNNNKIIIEFSASSHVLSDKYLVNYFMGEPAIDKQFVKNTTAISVDHVLPIRADRRLEASHSEYAQRGHKLQQQRERKDAFDFIAKIKNHLMQALF